MAGLHDVPISNAPIAVIDLETTGLSSKYDRVVEISVFRVDPTRNDQPEWVLDTLVNPHRPMAATEIHGITDRDVSNAPAFSDIADDVLEAVSGCVVASYNVAFDMGFLVEEFALSGKSFSVPHLCLMYLRQGLKMGNRCTLASACSTHGIELHDAHTAGTDGYASAQLVPLCRKAAIEGNYRTFADLSRTIKHKYTRSWALSPLTHSGRGMLGPYKSRTGYQRASGHQTSQDHIDQHVEALNQLAARAATAEYWDALTTVLADAQVTDDEANYLKQIRKNTGLSAEAAMSLHTRAFIGVLQQLSSDNLINRNDVELIRRVRSALHKAGYAPGD